MLIARQSLVQYNEKAMVIKHSLPIGLEKFKQRQTSRSGGGLLVRKILLISSPEEPVLKTLMMTQSGREAQSF